MAVLVCVALDNLLRITGIDWKMQETMFPAEMFYHNWAISCHIHNIHNNVFGIWHLPLLLQLLLNLLVSGNSNWKSQLATATTINDYEEKDDNGDNDDHEHRNNDTNHRGNHLQLFPIDEFAPIESLEGSLSILPALLKPCAIHLFHSP